MNPRTSGYSPGSTVDAELISTSFRFGRTPPRSSGLRWSSLPDTQKRTVPRPLAGYLLGLDASQSHAIAGQDDSPDRFHLIPFRGLSAKTPRRRGAVCQRLGVSGAGIAGGALSLEWTTHTSVYPGGTIRIARPPTSEPRDGHLSHTSRGDTNENHQRNEKNTKQKKPAKRPGPNKS